ncbi:hypothetical protein ACVDG5_021830 [Mesorhizobium sp. ORM6]
MHVVTLLKSEMFDVEIDGKPASIARTLPDWNPHDRFGLVIDDALGGIGAIHLLQIAITSFYDVKPSRRTEMTGDPAPNQRMNVASLPVISFTAFNSAPSRSRITL